MRKIIGLIAFFATGVGLLISALNGNMNLLNVLILALFAIFFVIGVGDHLKELQN